MSQMFEIGPIVIILCQTSGNIIFVFVSNFYISNFFIS